MNNIKVDDFAKENGYLKAVYICDWNGFQCFEPIFSEDDVAYIGIPQIILVDDEDNIRISTTDEAMKIISSLD